MSYMSFLANPAFWSGVSSAASVASAGVGIAQAAGAFGGNKAPEAQMPVMEKAEMPKAPEPEDAMKKAEEEAKKRRKTLLASGGNTNLTKGTGEIQEGQVARKTLLGG